MHIGILGGGQLAMMMIQMSRKYNFDFIVVDPSDNPPASKYARHIKSNYNDKNTLNLLINECDVITIDFENVPADALKYLEGKIKVYPNSVSVEVCQDRLKEKNLFQEIGIPTTQYKKINSEEDLISAIGEIGNDSILKSRKFGYDGKNQISMDNCTPENAWLKSSGVEAILEKKVNFKTEVSLIGVKTEEKTTFFYPLVENFHQNGILNSSIAPYENKVLQKQAENYHNLITDKLNYIGVFVIEFFINEDNGLIANEMAPRVHNSGHWTNEGADISQFEAHIMAITNLEIKSISISGYSGMVNILSKMPNEQKLINNSSYNLYDYGKSERENRKLGHITCVKDNRNDLIENINDIKSMLI